MASFVTKPRLKVLSGNYEYWYNFNFNKRFIDLFLLMQKFIHCYIIFTLSRFYASKLLMTHESFITDMFARSRCDSSFSCVQMGRRDSHCPRELTQLWGYMQVRTLYYTSFLFKRNTLKFKNRCKLHSLVGLYFAKNTLL